MNVGVVIVTHYRLGEEFLQALRLIVPDAPPMRSVSVDPKQPVDEMRKAIADCLRAADTGEGVLVLTDMFGGTPTNLSLAFLSPQVELVTGVNLPMLIKLSQLRDGELREVARQVRDRGRESIYVAGEALEQG